MKIVVGALALALPLSIPVLAQGETSQSKAVVKQKVQKSSAAKQARREIPHRAQAYSPFVHHPSYDVYVNGVYVGSDPDPRVRWTIKREWCQDQIDGC